MIDSGVFHNASSKKISSSAGDDLSYGIDLKKETG